MATPNFPKPAPGSQNSNTIAAQYARAKALKDAEGKPKTAPAASAKQQKSTAERLNEVKKERFMSEWWWVLGAFVWFLFIHVTGLYYFTKGFLLTRLVLEEHSACAVPPIAPITSFKGIGTVEAGGNLAAVTRMAAAGIKRYQAAYYAARGIETSTAEGSPHDLWETAEKTLVKGGVKDKMFRDPYLAFSAYQEETLRICRDLWARFDVPNDEDSIEDLELERAEQQMELEVFAKGAEPVEAETTSRDMVRTAAIGTALGVATGPIFRILMGGDSLLNFGLAPGAIGGLIGVLGQEGKGRMKSIGFASNSYTIWEDSILLFFLTTFGVAAAVKSLRLEKIADRTLGVYHSAPWQLLIPFVLAGFLPSIIKSYYAGSRSYEGFAPVWIGWVFRGGLVLSAIFWTLDAADDAEWFPNLPSGLLKNIRVPIAQTILAIALGAGTTAFIYAPPCVSITTIPGASTSASQPVPAKATVTILGFANVHGTRYLLLVLNILLTLLLVQKPMGFGALSLMTWQSLSLLELLDLTSLTTSPIGPITLALLSSFHFFKTGHQATLASIQWESAFIPLHSILYPYSPILVALNSYGAQILGVVFLPLIILWKQKPKKRGILRSLIAALAWHVAYFATISLATTMWAGHLRRHLMLYRIFCPKFMSAAAALVLVDLFGIAVALTGVRWNSGSVGEIFGWGKRHLYGYLSIHRTLDAIYVVSLTSLFLIIESILLTYKRNSKSG
ncbi:putative GPI ethanolamine phosphate transferase 3 [Glarea lozoyensis 74030]|uniref:Putative GPI ethanolamine phosphate transferase 3 n=1 Tax=Glarea lozoyensis (strain ATCC 74030 / MF5533) TaxID=1104152 RepID=H0ECE2_GLAL7|nr:putative GPI ethanolamine phosphate transferase 3 [Glarea lozoyensis 74030]